MSLLCWYCSSEVFGPAGWQKMWAFERSFPGHRILSFKRSCAELLHSADLQCWFCRYNSNEMRKAHVDLDEIVATGQDASCEFKIYFRNIGKLTPLADCSVVGSIISVSNAKDRASMALSPEPASYTFNSSLGATTTPGR